MHHSPDTKPLDSTDSSNMPERDIVTVDASFPAWQAVPQRHRWCVEPQCDSRTHQPTGSERCRSSQTICWPIWTTLWWSDHQKTFTAASLNGLMERRMEGHLSQVTYVCGFGTTEWRVCWGQYRRYPWMQEPLVDGLCMHQLEIVKWMGCTLSSRDHFSKKSGRTTCLGGKLSLHVLVAGKNRSDLVVKPGISAPGHTFFLPVYWSFLWRGAGWVLIAHNLNHKTNELNWIASLSDRLSQRKRWGAPLLKQRFTQ